MHILRAAIPLAMSFALIASPASAQDAGTFIANEFGWSMTGFMGTCTVSNRPVTDFGVAPVNGLVLRREAGSASVYAEVNFWPGALSPALN